MVYNSEQKFYFDLCRCNFLIQRSKLDLLFAQNFWTDARFKEKFFSFYKIYCNFFFSSLPQKFFVRKLLKTVYCFIILIEITDLFFVIHQKYRFYEPVTAKKLTSSLK